MNPAIRSQEQLLSVRAEAALSVPPSSGAVCRIRSFWKLKCSGLFLASQSACPAYHLFHAILGLITIPRLLFYDCFRWVLFLSRSQWGTAAWMNERLLPGSLSLDPEIESPACLPPPQGDPTQGVRSSAVWPAPGGCGGHLSDVINLYWSKSPLQAGWACPTALSLCPARVPLPMAPPQPRKLPPAGLPKHSSESLAPVPLIPRRLWGSTVEIIAVTDPYPFLAVSQCHPADRSARDTMPISHTGDLRLPFCLWTLSASDPAGFRSMCP